jgi:hypothetical protein
MSKSKVSDYSIGLMHEVALTAAKAEFTPHELHMLTEKEFRIIRAIRRGESVHDSWVIDELLFLRRALNELTGFTVRSEEWVREILPTVDVPDSVMWRNNYRFTGTGDVCIPDIYYGDVKLLAWHWTESEGDGQSRFFSLWIALPSETRSYHFGIGYKEELYPRKVSEAEFPDWVTAWLSEQEASRRGTKAKQS